MTIRLRRPPSRPPFCELRLHVSGVSLCLCVLVLFAESSIYYAIVHEKPQGGLWVTGALVVSALFTMFDVAANDMRVGRWIFKTERTCYGLQHVRAILQRFSLFLAEIRGFVYYFHAVLHAAFVGVIVSSGFEKVAVVPFLLQAGVLAYIGWADVRIRHVKPRSIVKEQLRRRQCDTLPQ